MVQSFPWNGRRHYGTGFHGSATTTEAVRRAIQNSQESLRALSARYGINQKTVAKWRKRTSVADLPTGPKDAKSTVLPAARSWRSASAGPPAAGAARARAAFDTALEPWRARVSVSRLSPGTPSSRCRCCQRQTVGFAMPVRRMIPKVPSPSAVASQANLPVHVHDLDPAALPGARKGKVGRLLRRPPQAQPAAAVADLLTAVFTDLWRTMVADQG